MLTPEAQEQPPVESTLLHSELQNSASSFCSAASREALLAEHCMSTFWCAVCGVRDFVRIFCLCVCFFDNLSSCCMLRT